MLFDKAVLSRHFLMSKRARPAPLPDPDLQDPVAEGLTYDDLNKYKLMQLKNMCKEKKIPFPSRVLKDELINLLLQESPRDAPVHVGAKRSRDVKSEYLPKQKRQAKKDEEMEDQDIGDGNLLFGHTSDMGESQAMSIEGKKALPFFWKAMLDVWPSHCPSKMKMKMEMEMEGLIMTCIFI